MSAGPAAERVEVVGGEELAVLVQVGAVGVERVAREAALQLQVGEEVEDEALEAAIRCGDWRWRSATDHAAGVLRSAARPSWARGLCGSPRPPPRQPRRFGEDAARGEGRGEEERVLRDGATHRPRREAGGLVAAEVDGASWRRWRQPAAVARTAIGTGSLEGTGTSTAAQQQLQHGEGVVAHRAVALAGVGAGEAGREQGRQAEGEGRRARCRARPCRRGRGGCRSR